MTTAIDAMGLVETIGTTRALDGLDITVERSEVCGFIGPNGAGKSHPLFLGLLHNEVTGEQASLVR